jgi:hypothetical protein
MAMIISDVRVPHMTRAKTSLPIPSVPIKCWEPGGRRMGYARAFVWSTETKIGPKTPTKTNAISVPRPIQESTPERLRRSLINGRNGRTRRWRSHAKNDSISLQIWSGGFSISPSDLSCH